MRPDRLVVGEVREAESLDLLIALNSGLPGMSSIHANSARGRAREAVHPAAAGRPQHRLRLRRAGGRRMHRRRRPLRAAGGHRRVAEIAAPTGQGGGWRGRGGRTVRVSRDGCCEPTGTVPARVPKFAAAGIDVLQLLARQGSAHEPRARRCSRPAGCCSWRPRGSGRGELAAEARRRGHRWSDARERLVQAGLGSVPIAVFVVASFVLGAVGSHRRARRHRGARALAGRGRCHRGRRARRGGRLACRARRQAARTVWPDVVDQLVSAVRSGLALPDGVATLATVGPAASRASFAEIRGRLPQHRQLRPQPRPAQGADSPIRWPTASSRRCGWRARSAAPSW